MLSVYKYVYAGFAGDMDEDVARRVSEDPRVVSVDEDDSGSGQPSTQPNAPWDLVRIDSHPLATSGDYSYANDGSGVAIYILDNGVRVTHSEFASGRVANQVDFRDATLVSNDENGAPCTTPPPTGGNIPSLMVQGVTEPEVQENDHGNFVASLAAGAMYGVAKGATIISVIVADQCTRSDLPSFTNGLKWVLTDVQNNPGRRAVVNLSYVFVPQNGDDAEFHAAIQSLVQANVPVVVAAGNASVNASAYVPASYSEVIAVGGTDMTDSRWVNSSITPGNENAGSNYGSALSLFAPAVNIPGADDSSDTASGFGTGTSAAAPLVAGIVARYLEAVPSATASGVRAALVQFATTNVVQNAGAGSPTGVAYVGFIDDIVTSGGGGPGCPGTSNTLCPGQVLGPNGAFGSPHGVYFLVYQLDGNLVEYNTNGFQAGGGAVWASNTAGTNPGSVVMSPNGALQVYDASGQLLWQSPTGQPGAYLSLADTGTLSVLASSGSLLWSNGVSGGGGGNSCPGASNMLCPGQTLGQNQAFGSPSGIYFLAMQSNGDLEEFNTSEFQAGDGPVWTSNTGGPNPGWAEMQTDGDFVVFDGSGNQLWDAGTGGNAGAYLVLGDDGSLVVVANDGVTVIATVYQGGG